MKLLTRFLLAHFSRILLLSLAAFTGIYLLIDFFEKVSDFIDHKAAAGDYLIYLGNSIPVIISQIMPLAVLLTVVLTLGGLGRSHETTAMRACGISLWKIIQPFMALALAISLLLMLLNEFLLPINAKQLNDLLEIKLKGKQQLAITHDKIWFRDQGRIIKVAMANTAEQKLYGVTIFTIDADSQILERQEIASAQYENGIWAAPEALLRRFDPQNGDLLSTTRVQNANLHIDRKPQDFSIQEEFNNELNFRQLALMVEKLDAEGLDSTRHRVDMHSRLATPFTSLIMAFLGVPFALQRGRRSNVALGIGLSVGIGVVYFILQSLVMAFGYSGVLPPILAAWTSNLMFLLLGIWMLLSVKQ